MRPNVIIFSAINKTETKGRNIVTLINQIPTSEVENCGEGEDGEIQIERMVCVYIYTYTHIHNSEN